MRRDNDPANVGEVRDLKQRVAALEKRAKTKPVHEMSEAALRKELATLMADPVVTKVFRALAIERTLAEIEMHAADDDAWQSAMADIYGQK